MLKFLIQKRAILILLLFSVFLVLVFSVKTDWLKKPAFLDTLNKNLVQKLNKTSQVLAQEYTPYFFPRFPQRLIYVLSEANWLIEELVVLNEELNKQLRKSNCKFAVSQCLPRITFGGLGCTPARVLGVPYKNIKEIEEKKEEIGDRIDNLLHMRKLLVAEMESGLPKELETLRPEVAEELRNNLEKVLKESEKIILTAKKNQDLYNKDYTEKCIAQCQPGPVCGIKACLMVGTGPQRQIEIKAEMEVSLDDLKLGEVGMDKFGLALPDKLQFPQLGDIAITIPPQTLQVCFPLQPITVSAEPPSLATLPTLSFTCPKLPRDLKLPQLPVLKLPKDIEIPFPEIPKTKWCPDIPEIPLTEELEKIRQELITAAEQEIEVFKNKIDEAINQIDKMIEKAPDKTTKEALEEFKETLQKEYEKVKEKIPKEAETPPTKFETPGVSKKYQYQSPQYGQTGDKKVETRAGINWYFETLSWLMEECTKLPIMSGWLGLQEKAASCYDPKKMVKTIVNECNRLWADYCRKDEEGRPTGPEPPPLCKKIRYSCKINGDVAAAIQCQNLFKQERLPVPLKCSYYIVNVIVSEYGVKYEPCPVQYPIQKGRLCLPKNFNPVPALKNKCQGLKDKYPKKPPKPCKILPLFTGKIEEPQQETYYGTPISYPAQNLLNTPFGFGGGLGFNCPIGLPSLPKIVLPDIVIPDIILPEFGIPPFLRVELPSIIIEDLILPDVELCDLNDCANVFPSLHFKLPQLRLPTLDISTPLPQLPGLDLRTRIDLLSINFSLPQINLFNLLLPKLELPKISIPSPKIDFRITGIDMSAIFGLIFTFILNAMDVSDFGYCLAFKIPTTFLSIVYPDYYFSFLKFPRIPEIPFCENVNQFCKNVKNALGPGGWLKKANEIETEFSKTIDKIQKEINKISEAGEDIQKAIGEVFKEIYGKAIHDAISKQLVRKGLSLEDYINPRTKEIDLSKVPFPGVFPVKTIDGRECLPVSVPQADIILRIVNKKDHPQKKIVRKLSPPPIQFVIYVPVDIPVEIPIHWPKNMKEINLINPLTYDLPGIPLSDLSYKKEFPIKVFGFQPRTFHFDFGRINEGDCLAKPPTGGNPFPISQINGKINEIKSIQTGIESASETIIRILE